MTCESSHAERRITSLAPACVVLIACGDDASHSDPDGGADAGDDASDDGGVPLDVTPYEGGAIELIDAALVPPPAVVDTALDPTQVTP